MAIDKETVRQMNNLVGNARSSPFDEVYPHAAKRVLALGLEMALYWQSRPMGAFDRFLPLLGPDENFTSRRFLNFQIRESAKSYDHRFFLKEYNTCWSRLSPNEQDRIVHSVLNQIEFLRAHSFQQWTDTIPHLQEFADLRPHPLI